MRAFARRYGAHPLHLLGFLASFALAGYAARQLFNHRPIAVAVWLVGAAVGHDLLLFPLYALADAALPRRKTGDRVARESGWINYIRVPAGVSLLLLLVFAPSILRRSPIYQRTTALPYDRFLTHWLLVTGVLFLLSAITYALRVRRGRRRMRRL